MEEQQERRNVGEIELEGGQPIRNSGQTGPELREHRMDIVEISPRVKNWIGSFKKAEESTQSQTQRPRIPKVPQMLRGTQNIKKIYELRDLFLLENQLPFGVLKLIFEGTNFQGGLPMEKNIKIFITYFGMPEGLSSEIQLEEVNEEPSHLLDLLRSALLGQSQPEQEQQPEKKGKSSSSQGGKWGVCCRWKKGKQRGIWQFFRHIKELKAAGIYLKPSRTCFLRDISFKSYFFFGYLKLPPITIDDFTKTKFLNMAAYEMCPDAPDDYGVTSYIRFLYDLIDHADDVKELRSKHILHNLLGSDDDVAKIFNEISNDLVDPEAYKDVKDCIQKHYDKRVNTWTAQALHNHFRSPWTVMAFIAALLILFLTGFRPTTLFPRNKDV
ncbi:UPF0481 protein [Vitis vinifera]|uniref:UPF0481 protein n=1 Tax=Vitis vinifera TaxID=29760 RepID=A0A438FQT3_VITVI|nr:UPF0481 protein [Vitis vinifera]